MPVFCSRVRKNCLICYDDCKVKKYEAKMSNPIEMLPNELGVSIFSFLKNADINSCCKVCTRWKQVGNSNELWKIVISNKKWGKTESVGSMIGRRVAVLKEQGYTDQQIKWQFELEYRRMKNPFSLFLC
jgi:F-box-like